MNINSIGLIIGLSEFTNNKKENIPIVEHMSAKTAALAAGLGAVGTALPPFGPFGGALIGLVGGNILGFEKNPTTLTIEQEINNFINTTQQQAINVATQSIINISHSIVQQQVAKITNNTDTKNDMDASEIVITNGASFSVEQQNNLKTVVQAILNLVQSSELISSLSTQIKNDILITLSQNAELSNKIAAASTLLKSQKNSGELNNAISGIKDIASKIADLGTSRADNTVITNSLLNNINLDSSARADINDYIDNTINISIKQLTINTCVQSNNILNQVYLKQIMVDGENSSFEIIQENILLAYFKCVITSVIKNENLQNISIDTLNNAALLASQGAKVSNDLKATKEVSNITSTTSFLDSFSGMGFAIVLVIIIVGFVFLMK